MVNYTQNRHAALRCVKDKVPVKTARALMDCVRLGLVDWERDAHRKIVGVGVPVLTHKGADLMREWDAPRMPIKSTLTDRIASLELRVLMLEQTAQREGLVRP